MDTIPDLLQPTAVAIISVILTAVVTIQIKFAATKEEAYSGLKAIVTKGLFFLWNCFLGFLLISELLSTEPLTRAGVFGISIYSISLALNLVFYFMTKIFLIFKLQNELIERVRQVFEKHLERCHPEIIDANSESSKNV